MSIDSERKDQHSLLEADMRIVFFSKCATKPRADRKRAVEAWAVEQGHEVVADLCSRSLRCQKEIPFHEEFKAFEILGFCKALDASAIAVWRFADLGSNFSSCHRLRMTLMGEGIDVLPISEPYGDAVRLRAEAAAMPIIRHWCACGVHRRRPAEQRSGGAR